MTSERDLVFERSLVVTSRSASRYGEVTYGSRRVPAGSAARNAQPSPSSENAYASVRRVRQQLMMALLNTGAVIQRAHPLMAIAARYGNDAARRIDG
jgi:hypothetical protein